MADKAVRLYLEHIREAIEQYVGGRQRPDLDHDPTLRQAIERNIEIISEASRRLPDEMKARYRTSCGRRSPPSAMCFAASATWARRR